MFSFSPVGVVTKLACTPGTNFTVTLSGVAVLKSAVYTPFCPCPLPHESNTQVLPLKSICGVGAPIRWLDPGAKSKSPRHRALIVLGTVTGKPSLCGQAEFGSSEVSVGDGVRSTST